MTRREAETMYGQELIAETLGPDPWYWDGDRREEYLQDWQVEQLETAEKKECHGD